MAVAVLERSTRDPLAGLSNAEFEARLREVLGGRVEQSWVFGSYGTPRFGPESDVDLILVVDTDRPFLERARSFEDLLDLGPRLDLLVYTPAEFARLTNDPSPGFWRQVVPQLRRIL